MRIIGIDPSIRSTGYGVIDVEGNKMSAVAYGTIPNPLKRSPEMCLLNIVENLRDVLQKYKPEQAAIEKIIFVQSVRTAIIMGTARGAALIAVAELGIPISEYPAKSVKMAATGSGAAQKQQVGFMMRVLLGLKTTPQSDEGDALAIALTHARQLQGKRAWNSGHEGAKTRSIF